MSDIRALLINLLAYLLIMDNCGRQTDDILKKQIVQTVPDIATAFVAKWTTVYCGSERAAEAMEVDLSKHLHIVFHVWHNHVLQL